MELLLYINAVHADLLVACKVDMRRREALLYLLLATSRASVLSSSNSMYSALQRCNWNVAGLALFA
eukprot:6467751-Amphidinium_carterae.1